MEWWSRYSQLLEGVGYRIYMKEVGEEIIYCKDTTPWKRFIFTFIWNGGEKLRGRVILRDTRTN